MKLILGKVPIFNEGIHLIFKFQIDDFLMTLSSLIEYYLDFFDIPAPANSYYIFYPTLKEREKKKETIVRKAVFKLRRLVRGFIWLFIKLLYSELQNYKMGEFDKKWEIFHEIKLNLDSLKYFLPFPGTSSNISWHLLDHFPESSWPLPGIFFNISQNVKIITFHGIS